VVQPGTGVLARLITRKHLLKVRAEGARSEGERTVFFRP
jgi:hypothetical protein